MKKKIIISVVVIIICISIYFLLYTYTNKINEKNIYNKFEFNVEEINGRLKFLNEYITTIKKNDYEVGFYMLNEDTRTFFDNDLNKYFKFLNNLGEINNEVNGIEFNIRNIKYMKFYNIIEYDIISKEYKFIRDNIEYFIEEYPIFSEFKLIEYTPNSFEIHIR